MQERKKNNQNFTCRALIFLFFTGIDMDRYTVHRQAHSHGTIVGWRYTNDLYRCLLFATSVSLHFTVDNLFYYIVIVITLFYFIYRNTAIELSAQCHIKVHQLSMQSTRILFWIDMKISRQQKRRKKEEKNKQHRTTRHTFFVFLLVCLAK